MPMQVYCHWHFILGTINNIIFYLSGIFSLVFATNTTDSYYQAPFTYAGISEAGILALVFAIWHN